MGAYKCMICDDKIAVRAIDEEIAKGMSGEGISKLMTLRGWPVSAGVVNEHRKHRTEKAVAPEVLAPKDAAIFVRDAQMRALQQVVERAPDPAGAPNLDILDKDLQPAIKSVLTAQRDLDRRVGRTNDQKTQIAIALLLSGAEGGLAAVPEHLRLGDGNTVEGEFEVLDGPS